MPNESRRRRIAALVFAAAGVVAAAGCVTESVEPTPPAPGELPPPRSGEALPSTPSAPSAQPKSPEALSEFGRTLQTLDRWVDEYVSLAATPGEEARNQRTVKGAAIESEVQKFVEPLLGLALDAEAGARQRIAVKALAFVRPERADQAAATLVRIVDLRTERGLLTAATFALSRIASPRMPLDPVLGVVASDDRDVRSNALLTVWNVLEARQASGDPVDAGTRAAVLPVVEGALFDLADPLVRGHAAAALGALGDPQAVDPLLNLLRDGNAFVRTQTSLALGKLGDQRAVPAIAELLDESPKGTVRGAMILAIRLLLEKRGIAAPTDLPDDERAWRAYLERLPR
ncbi:MAG: hypothetical protein HMLKMBBP_03416 [Planctomycetes bacterium]|nr:hypothetical protein [Planctomycetota bacterium]